MYSEYSRFRPNRFTFGGFIAEHVNTVIAPYSNSSIGSSTFFNNNNKNNNNDDDDDDNDSNMCLISLCVQLHCTTVGHVILLTGTFIPRALPVPRLPGE